VGDVTLTDIQLVYWSGTEYGFGYAWVYFFDQGDQNNANERSDAYGWAVRSGDVGAVPVPAALWLFGSAIAGIGYVARRRRARDDA